MRRAGGCESGTCNIQRARIDDPDTAVWSWSPHWLWLMLPFVVAIVGSAMLPPLDFDVREYHLQAPKEFFQAGRITFLPHNVYANMPLGTEMLALAGMVISGDWWTGALVGKTLIALFAPLAALLLYAAGCRFASPAAGVVAALVYISLPWVAIVSTHGLVEGGFGFFLFASLFVALIWRNAWHADSSSALPDRASKGLLATAGFLAGGAVSTKYPAVVYCAIPLAVFVALIAGRAMGIRNAVKATVVFLLGISVGCGLWFAKNAVLTGNPTYPLLYRAFDGETRTPEKEAQWQHAHQPPNYELADLAQRVKSLVVGGTWLSPLVVPLVGLAFFARRQRRLAVLLAVAVLLIFAAWWLLTHRIDRFLVPIWPLVALLAGLGATWSFAKPWKRSLAGFLLLGLVYNFVVVAGGVVADNRYLAPLEELRAESVALDPWHTYLNEHADEVRGVLLVGDAQPFDLEVPAQYNTVFDTSIFEDLARGKSPQQVRDALSERGISHVYVSWPEIDRYRSPGNYGITEFLQPRIFADLVSAGVLEPVKMLATSRAQMFRVIAQ
jgi:4-amino-4-deoxy-L-arabinose transferase-like glycosyltransferase